MNRPHLNPLDLMSSTSSQGEDFNKSSFDNRSSSSLRIQDDINETIDLLVVLRDAITNSQVNPNTSNYFVLINIIQNKLESVQELVEAIVHEKP
ncbi:MAG: hypothetical protein SFU91_13080 [Chloroherpetonaceae bacterium]|nr:hypothetical protein [Chloroherpetonaceae bacterium]